MPIQRRRLVRPVHPDIGTTVLPRPLTGIRRNMLLAAVPTSRLSSLARFTAEADTFIITEQPQDAGEACPLLDLNHNGENLAVEQTTDPLGKATRKKSFMRFNVGSIIPTGSTIYDISLYLKPTGTAGAAQTLRTGSIAAASEGWSETGLTCGNAPTITHREDVSVPAAADRFVLRLGQAWRDVLTARVASPGSNLTLVFYVQQDLSRTFEDREGGASVAPELVVNYLGAPP